jgi:prepilin-type N-terminal cleavage/methylation domain-containing protein
MRERRQEAGFTLIELMIVMSIIAVLAASIIPIWKVYKEKALVARAQQGAGCLQTTLVGLDTLSADDRTATLHGLGGSAAEFYATVEGLGCRLGPTPTDLKADPIVGPKECKVQICRDGLRIREELCLFFDETQLSPGEYVCSYYQLLSIPNVFSKQIEITDSHIEVQTILH